MASGPAGCTAWRRWTAGMIHSLALWVCLSPPQVQVPVPRHLAALARASSRGRRAADQIHWLQTGRVQVREVSGWQVTVTMFRPLSHSHLERRDSFSRELRRLASRFAHPLNLNAALYRKHSLCPLHSQCLTPSEHPVARLTPAGRPMV